MRYAGKICGVFTAGLLGSLIFMAPDTFSGDKHFADLTTGKLPATAIGAGKAPPTRAIAQELAKIEVSDDAYYEARMKLIADDEAGDLLARLDAAGDAHFRDAMALGGIIVEHGQLAELNASTEIDFEAVIAQMEAVDPSATGSLPPVSAMDDLEERITGATLPMQAMDTEPADDDFPQASTALYDNLPDGMPIEGEGKAGPSTQDMASSYPAAGPPSAAAGEKADLAPVRMANSAPEATAAAAPAEKAARMPAPDMHAVAKKRDGKRTRSARLEVRSAEKKRPVGPIRKFFRMIARGLRPDPQQ